MKTHNVSIYHCVHCGRVVHTELDEAAPMCCGHLMTRACEETVAEGTTSDESATAKPENWPEADWPVIDADP
jgi:hypothetical protein